MLDSIKGDSFVIKKGGVWAGDGQMVEMGEMVCKALPNVSNAGIRMQVSYQHKASSSCATWMLTELLGGFSTTSS